MHSIVKKEKIREHLYLHGFDIDGIHYVRYKRSAGSSRDGRCLFIAEPLCQDMMEWSSCGLSSDTVSDQASWQAYIALTLSSIESTIRLPKKAILIIPDKVSRFKTTAVCVKEDKALGLTAAEEETEIENVIWDGEALLDVSEFERAGYKEKGMMLLHNRFFKTCAFNTNLQDWFFDNDITQISQLAATPRRGIPRTSSWSSPRAASSISSLCRRICPSRKSASASLTHSTRARTTPSSVWSRLITMRP